MTLAEGIFFTCIFGMVSILLYNIYSATQLFSNTKIELIFIKHIGFSILFGFLVIVMINNYSSALFLGLQNYMTSLYSVQWLLFIIEIILRFSDLKNFFSNKMSFIKSDK